MKASLEDPWSQTYTLLPQLRHNMLYLYQMIYLTYTFVLTNIFIIALLFD